MSDVEQLRADDDGMPEREIATEVAPEVVVEQLQAAAVQLAAEIVETEAAVETKPAKPRPYVQTGC
jgi:hypothetical protein